MTTNPNTSCSVDALFLSRKFLPYFAERLPDGRYILGNRDYKPIGCISEDDWIDYAKWPISLALELSPEQAAVMSHCGDANIKRIYFYDDGCKPWESAENDLAYRRRLALFFMLEGMPPCPSAGRVDISDVSAWRGLAH